MQDMESFMVVICFKILIFALRQTSNKYERYLNKGCDLL